MKPSRAAVLLFCLAGCRAAREGGSAAAAPVTAPKSQRLESVAPELQPSFVALAAAVEAGEDEVAERILERLAAVADAGRAGELVQGYQRILAGRALVRRLELELVCRAEPEPEGRATPDAGAGSRSTNGSTVPASGGSATPAIDERSPPVSVAADLPAVSPARAPAAPLPRRWHLFLVVRSRESEPVVLQPGPGQLRIERSAVDPLGNEERAVELRPLARLAELVLPPSGTVEVELASEALMPPRGALVARTTFELELRSGVARVAGRELPAMRVHVAPAEALAHAGGAVPRPTAPEDLVGLAKATASTARAALELAVAIPREERAAAIEAIAVAEPSLSDLAIKKLVPALRFLSSDTRPGGAPQSWREWLRRREARRSAKAPRPNLILPPAARP